MADYTVAFSELDALLQSLPANSSSNPYSINVTGLTESDIYRSSYEGTLGYLLRNNATKFVDLSETILPEVTSLRSCFSNCTNLITAPNIPNSVTDMTYCFSFCTSLTTAPVISNSVTIMESCFRSCHSLTTAPVIPHSVTNMTLCFDACTSLTTAPNIPNSVTNMNSCFGYCTSLTTAPVIPHSVTNMTSCFDNCTSLTTAPNIPNSVTSMLLCFLDCTSLTTAPVIPNSVTNMKSCFRRCTSLTTVPVIPNSVTNMNWCFEGCTSLAEVSILAPSGNLNTISCFNNTTQSISVKTQNKNALEEKLSTPFPNNVTIQQELNWEVPFDNLNGFLSGCVNSPSSVYRLNVTGLQESDIGSSFLEGTFGYVIRNNNGVYADYSETVLPEVTSMSNCFDDCITLTNAPVIPNSVTDMAECFHGCTNLTTIDNFQADTENCDMTDCFSGCMSLSYIGVPETLPNATKWQFVHAVEDSDGITMTIGTDDTEPVEVETSEHTYGIIGLICDMLFSEDAFDSTRISNYLASRMPWIVESPTSLDANEDWTVIWAKDPTKVKSNFIPTINDTVVSENSVYSSAKIDSVYAKKNDIPEDYVIEEGTSGIWRYEKWKSGKAECWQSSNYEVTGSTQQPLMGGYYSQTSISLPTNLFTAYRSIFGNAILGTGMAFVTLTPNGQILSASVCGNQNSNRITFYGLHVIGIWKL